ILLSSCKNDLDTNADWKEILVVYSLLDGQDSVHYVRVNRAFLNENQSAYEIARINDSLYFDSIEVKIVEQGTGRIIPLVKDESKAKDSGIFANYPNVLYRANSKLFYD